MMKRLISFLMKKKQGTSLPEEFGLVAWSSPARRLHGRGDSNKVINLYRHKRHHKTDKYSPIREAMYRYVLKIPIWDMTEGTEQPDLEWYHTINPAIVETHRF